MEDKPKPKSDYAILKEMYPGWDDEDIFDILGSVGGLDAFLRRQKVEKASRSGKTTTREEEEDGAEFGDRFEE